MTLRVGRITVQPRSAHGQDGAYLVEYLGAMIALFAFMLLVVQVVLVFINAITVNHALGLAAQEAAARGGVDDNVAQQFERHLPGSLRDAGESLLCRPVGCQIDGTISPGLEPTRSGDLMTLEYNYVQSFDLLRLIGIDTGVAVQRSVKVTSQSAKEDE